MIYEFIDKTKHIVRHNPSGMLFQILLNPEDEIDYDVWDDVYQEFEFKGNHIISLMLNPDDYEPEPLPIGYEKIHAINRKAFKFYKSKIYIEQYEQPEGDYETERYLLQQAKNGKDWVLTDKKYQIVLLWDDKKFNDSQKITPLEDLDVTKETMMMIPSILREAGEWLVENHSNKI